MYKKILCALGVFLFFSILSLNTFADVREDFEQAGVYIDAGQYEEAEAIYEGIYERVSDVNNLLDNLPEGWDVSEQLLGIAEFYRGAEEYASAKRIYEYLIETWPESNEIAFAKGNLAETNIMLRSSEICSEIVEGNIEQAASDVNDLLSTLPEGEDFSGVLTGIADCYRGEDEYNLARQLYQHVLDNWPECEDAHLAKVGLIESNIRAGNIKQADRDVNDLITNPPADMNLPDTLRIIADTYLQEDRTTQARELYINAVNSVPEGKQDIASWVNLVKSNLKLKDVNGYAASYEKLIADFNDHPELAAGLQEIGILCLDLQQEQEAAQVLQRVSEEALENEGEDAVFQSRLSLILKYICTEEDTRAQTAIDGFIADFRGRSDFGQSIAKIIKAYFMKVFYAHGTATRRDWVQPTVTWEKAQAADEEFFCDDPEVYFYIGCCYYRLGEYESALVYLKSVPYNWPESRWVNDAEYNLAKVEEKLAQ